MSQIEAILFLAAGFIGAVPIDNAYRGSLAWALVFLAGLLMLIN
jgi:hypothetical protein